LSHGIGLLVDSGKKTIASLESSKIPVPKLCNELSPNDFDRKFYVNGPTFKFAYIIAFSIFCVQIYFRILIFDNPHVNLPVHVLALYVFV